MKSPAQEPGFDGGNRHSAYCAGASSGVAPVLACGAFGSGAWLLMTAASFEPTFWARSRATPRYQISAALYSSRVTIGPSESSFLPASVP